MTRRATIQFFAILSLCATISYAVDDADPVIADSANTDSAGTDSGATEPDVTHSGDNGDAAAGETESQTTTPIADRAGAKPNELDGTDSGGVRLREGMKFVNRVGEFRGLGERMAFKPDGESYSLTLLENLAVERITNDVDQSHRKWSVTGIVTEYKGGNYLLLHRAVLKARVSNSPGPRS